MGVFDDIGNAIKNSVGMGQSLRTIGSGIGGDVGNFIGSAGRTVNSYDPITPIVNPNDPNNQNNVFKGVGSFVNPQPGAPGIPPADPNAANLARIKKEQELQAGNFRANMPGFENNVFNQVKRTEMQGLAGRLQQIKLDAARRGLMNSGIRLGNEANAQAESGANLAQANMDIKSQTEAQANQLDADAINAGMTQQRVESEIQDTIYNQALKNMMARNQGIASLGGGVGGLIGTAAGSQSKDSKNAANQSLYGS